MIETTAVVSTLESKLSSRVNGLVITDFGAADSILRLIQQTDGKLIAVGTTGSGDYNIALSRYNLDGSLDRTFDYDGKVTTDFAAHDWGFSVIQQADGKLVVAGSTYNRITRTGDFALSRYNTDGSLDATFSLDGKVTTDFGGSESSNCVIQQADGKLVAVGMKDNGAYGTELALSRYNLDGSLDRTFDYDGKVTTDFAAHGWGVSVIQQADGKLVVAGNTGTGNSDFALVRYNLDGSLDTQFGNGGKQVTDFGGYDTVDTVILQTDGKLVVTGKTENTSTTGHITASVSRYNPDGSLDTIFDNDGKITLDYNDTRPTSVILQDDGKLVVAGVSQGGFSLTRYNADGSLDNLFGNDGNVITVLGTGDWSTIVIQQADGKLVVGGHSESNFALVRYNYDGSLDSSFSSNIKPTGSVFISGTAIQGQTLTASNNLVDADGLGDISYQWQADGTDIGGATGNTLLLGQSQVGKAITVVASYVDGYGTAEAVSSSATTKVANVNDQPTGSVVISGTSTQGQTLTATNTLADVDGLGAISYQWKADGTDITGATSNTLLLGQSQVGKAITVVASYVDGYGTAESKTSTATGNVANINDTLTGTVAITGTATQGQTLTATNTLADVDGMGTISYQWKADGAAISGATAGTLVLGQAQVGKTITVVASYVDGYGTAESKSSAATSTVANVNDLPTGTVTISGTATQGQTLTASNTLADVDGMGTISYQWKADGNAITGATGSTLVLGQAQVGQTISVVANYTDLLGTAETVISSSTAKVVNVNDKPTGSVTVSGLGIEGQQLSATNKISDIDGLGLISYQWLRSGSVINGATLSTYMVTQQDQGEYISVQASYLDGGNTKETVNAKTVVMVLPKENVTGSAVKGVVSGGISNDVFDTSLNTGAKHQGGKGDDSYIVKDSAALINESSNQGTDTVFSSATFTLPLNVENLKLFGESVINAIGNKSNNVIVGNSAGNFIYGLEGNDTLTGGAGKDTFVFSTAPNAKTNLDTVTDFNPAEDTIGLKATIFKKIGSSVESSEIWMKTQGAAQTATQYLVYDSNTGTLSYDADGSGKALPIPVAIVGTGLNLGVDDFVVL